AGLGVAVLPAAPAERFSRVFAVRLLQLDEAWAARDYCLGVARQERLPAVVQRFVDALCPASKSFPSAESHQP
ncbi:MAG: LysR family transcriptional regulator, partial [Burkholderiaceae bacterium]